MGQKSSAPPACIHLCCFIFCNVHGQVRCPQCSLLTLLNQVNGLALLTSSILLVVPVWIPPVRPFTLTASDT